MADHSDNKLLHELLGAIRSIRDEIHAIGQDKRPTEHKNKEPVRIELASEVRFPVAVTEHYRAQQEHWKTVWERIKVGLETIAFVGAAIAAVYTVRTFHQIKRQADAAQMQVTETQRNFRIDERAWLRFNTDKEIAELAKVNVKTFKSLMINIDLANVGKTPATNIQMESMAKVASRFQVPVLNYPDGTLTTGTTGIIFQTTSVSTEFGSNAEVSDGDRKALAKGDAFLIYYGIVRFADVFGKVHETRVCWWHPFVIPGDYPAKPCSDYNYSDQN